MFMAVKGAQFVGEIVMYNLPATQAKIKVGCQVSDLLHLRVLPRGNPNTVQ